MNRDKIIGALLFVCGIIGIIIYGWLIFLTELRVKLLVLQITAFIAVSVVFGILAWIGYTLITTPSPKSVDEIEREIEKELKKLEQEIKEEEREKKDR